MSTPGISTNSDLARELAKALSKEVSRLDEMDGEKDNVIWIGGLKNNSSLRDRIFMFSTRPGYEICENAFLVDNGDGKIGNGDIFLHADGYHQQKDGRYAFRFAKLFAPRQLQEKQGSEAAASADLPVRINGMLLAPIESQKGKNFKDVLNQPLFSGICATVRMVNRN